MQLWNPVEGEGLYHCIFLLKSDVVKFISDTERAGEQLK